MPRTRARVPIAVLSGLLCLAGFAPAAEKAAPATPPALPPAVRTVGELQAGLAAHFGQPRFTPALWGVKIVSLDTGAVLFEHAPHRLMSPASNSKLYTGALALDVLGGDYRIVTPLLAAAPPDAAGTVRGDLVISGRGDPSWKSEKRREDFWTIFAPFVAALQRAGVRRITGDLVADTTHFHGPPNGGGWTADDLNDDYGAEISALTLEDNYADVRVRPAAQPGGPASVELLHPLTGLTLDNRVTTGPANAERQVVAQRIFDDTAVHLFGRLPAGGAELIVEVTVPRPADWFARALREALGRAGIAVDGRARSVRWPQAPAAGRGWVKLGEVASPPLRDLVQAFMKPSQNLETDLIFNHLGEQRREPGTPAWRRSEDLAVPILRDFLQRHGLPVEEVKFEEGSGLSRNNLTTAHATVALLRLMATHREAAAFHASLPIAGVDGTLRRRMKGTAAEGNVRAKTGTLRYANSIAGYVRTAAGERLAFCLMLNRNPGQPAGRNVREELDDVAVMLARFEGRSAEARVR